VSIRATRSHTMQARLGRCASCMRWTGFGAALSWIAFAATGLLLSDASPLAIALLALTVAACGVFTVLGLAHLITWWALRFRPTSAADDIFGYSSVPTTAALPMPDPSETTATETTATGCGVCGQRRRR
jgi:hypothetical protein